MSKFRVIEGGKADTPLMRTLRECIAELDRQKGDRLADAEKAMILAYFELVAAHDGRPEHANELLRHIIKQGARRE